MSVLNPTNSSLTFSSNDSIIKEVRLYVRKINFNLRFIQAFILIIALVGNTLALVVINRKSLRSTSSAVFITYMAIFDSVVLILHAVPLIRLRPPVLLDCTLVVLRDLFTFCANWILVIITIERCIAVSSPFLAKRFCTKHTARRSICILVSIAIFIFSSTFPVFYRIDGLTTLRKCEFHHKRSSNYRLIQLIIMYVIPDILLLSNLYTIYVLVRRKREQDDLSENKMNMRVSDISSNRKQRQLTIMLVTVNLAFYLFTAPAIIDYISKPLQDNTQDVEKLKRRFFWSQITVPILQLSNATNFIFYCFSGQRFRRTCVQTLREGVDMLHLLYRRYLRCDKSYQRTLGSQKSTSGISNTVKRNTNLQDLTGRAMRSSTL